MNDLNKELVMAAINCLKYEIEILKEELKEAEARGFRNGLRHATELAKQAKPSAKDLSREEWIAVEITHDAIVKKIYNGLSN